MTANGFLAGQVALVTGATKGIGQAIAHQLAQAGAHLVLNARTASKLQALAQDLRARYPQIQVLEVAGDVGDPVQVHKLVDAALRTFERVDILINNAGIAGKIALLHEVSVEEIDETLNTNLKGPIYLMKYVLPAMVAQGQGTIININSIAGKTAYPFWSIYDASKFGLRAITEAVSEEQRSNNIKVVGIYPGAVDTPLWETIELNHEPKREGMLDPETIAETVLYILKQPAKVFIPEVTLAPLQPAL